MKQARTYAKMFINTPGVNEDSMSELAVLSALKEKSREFSNVLENPVFTREERAGAITAVCGLVGTSEITAKFLVHLAEAGAAGSLGEIFEKALDLFREKHAKVKAVVVSSIEIDDASVERLKKALEKMSGKTVELETEQDPAIIGGMLVKIGSQMFDASIQGQLRQLKEELIKG